MRKGLGPGLHFIGDQVPTAHLERLGARLVSREVFRERLKQALEDVTHASNTRPGSWEVPGAPVRPTPP